MKLMSEPDFKKELKLDKNGAAMFLRELAASIEDDEDIMIEGEDWELLQPYKDTVPFRVVQDEAGIEVDLKILRPDQD